jgi:hypothetical protein
MTTRVPSATATRIRTAVGLAVLGGVLACAPRGEIADESKTVECREDLEQALEAFRTDLGLDYYVDRDDAQTLLDESRLEKDYAGLGVRYVAHFGLVKNSDGCHLKFYKRTSRQPGKTSSSTGNYGTMRLNRCRCR